MDAVWINFLYNPLIPIGILLSVLASFVFLLFLRGFLSGALYLITLNGNDEFLLAARQRVMWSFLLLIFLFCVWEILRWFGSIIAGNPPPRGLPLAIFFSLMLVFLVQVTKYTKKNLP